MSIFEIVDVGVRRDIGGAGNDPVDLGTQFGDLGRRQGLRHHDEAVLVIGIDLCGR